MLISLLTIWIMVYGRETRLYVVKDPPTIVRQWDSREACAADPAAVRPRAKCVEVKSTPSCFNDGSICTFEPVDEAGRALLPKMVPMPH